MLPPSTRRRYFLAEAFAERRADSIDAACSALSEEEAHERCYLAWRSGDADIFLELSFWLLRRELLTRKEALRLAQKLSEFGRHEEARAILTDARYVKAKAAMYWRDLAVALAGSGRLAEASQAIERATRMNDGTDPSDADFADALRLALGPAAELERTSDWGTRARLIEAHILLGSPGPAAEILAAAFSGASPRSDAEIIEALHLAQDVLRLAGPAEADAFIASWRAGFDRLGSGANQPGVQLCLALALDRQGRHEDAIGLLAPLASHTKGAEFEGAEASRIELARTIGRLVLDEASPRFGPGDRRKIVDMFPMNDELMMLRLKLEEMYEWVDHFVIVEARFTFRGEAKPLHFQQARSEFARFADKIVHVVVDVAPAWATTAWTREFYQRDCGLRGLKDLCGEDDLVLITDVDEIADRKAIGPLETQFVSLGMPSYAYFFNLERVETEQSKWGAAVRARYLEKLGPSYARLALPTQGGLRGLDNTGWHFSVVRDIDGLVTKFNSYSNTQWAGADRADFEKLIADIRLNHGHRGYVRREIDESFPEAIRRNLESLRSLIL